MNGQVSRKKSPAIFGAALFALTLSIEFAKADAYAQGVQSSSITYRKDTSNLQGKPSARPMARYLLSAPASVELSELRDSGSIAHKTSRGNHVNGRTRKLTPKQQIGAWELLPAGNRVWRLAIKSPGAVALRIHFTAFDAGSGNVWVYPPDLSPEAAAVGPYTGTGIHQKGDFWSGIVFSDTAVIEYDQNNTTDTSDHAPFTVEGIAHIYSLRSSEAAPVRPVHPQFDNAIGRLKSSQLQGGASGPGTLACEVDVNCVADLWKFMARSVGLYFAVEGDYLIACTGTLLNNKNQNFRPYFLTANHCVSDNDTAQSSIVVWNFATSFCNGNLPDPMQLPQQPVDRLLVTSPIDQGDFTLLLLWGDVPDGSVFSGWTTAEPAMGDFVAGIHHPMSTWKRFVSGNRVLDFDVSIVDDSGNVIGTAPAAMYYHASWTLGVTEPGSSGSPLFNSQGQLIGALSHGNVDCNSGFDGYGRFGSMFSALRRYLVDDNIAPASS